MEPHAQNVMIGLDANNMPNGEFMHRDFGGFNLDLKNFERLKTLLPKNLPTIQGIEEDYHHRTLSEEIAQLTDGRVKPTPTALKTKLSEVIEKARSQSTVVGALRCEMVFH